MIRERMERLNSREIGRRLRITRENNGYTQAELAELLGVARTTIVGIEKGDRFPRNAELLKFAKILNTSVNAILRDTAEYVSLIPKFRSLLSKDSERREAVYMLNKFVSLEIELENLLGINRIVNFVPDRPLPQRGDVSLIAEEDSAYLRANLGLGDGPIKDIVSLMELNLGFRVYIAPLASNISGLFAFDKDIGPCILLNIKHRFNRINFTAAHELGHFIATRNKVDIVDSMISSIYDKRSERHANLFAAAFLMPTRTVMTKFSELVAGSDRLTRYHVLLLSEYFNVSCESLVRRLEDLKLVPVNSWDWFQQNGGFKDSEVRQFKYFNNPLNDEVEKAYKNVDRIKLMARSALENGVFSEGQLSERLGLDRASLRDWLDLEHSKPGLLISNARSS